MCLLFILNIHVCLCNNSIQNTMIKLTTILMTLTIASIMIAGGIIVAPSAYSTDNNIKHTDDSKSKHDDSNSKPDDSKAKHDDDEDDGDLLDLICHDGKETKLIKHEDLWKQLHDHLVDPNGLDIPSNQKSNHPPSYLITSNSPQCGDKHDDEQGMASITVRKTITNDNGGTASPSDFTIKLINVDTLVEITLVQTIDPLVKVNMIPTGTYKIMETSVPGYTTVLIADDTECPATVNVPFTLKKGDNISCTIYNDDNGNGSSGGGIIFRHFSMQVQTGNNMLYDSCDGAKAIAAGKNSCIEIVNPEEDQIAIVDSALTSDNTIVLFSIIEAGQLETDLGAPNPVCTVSAIVEHDKNSFFLKDQSDADSLPTNPSMNNAVVLKCIGIETDKVYNVNYIMVDPTV